MLGEVCDREVELEVEEARGSATVATPPGFDADGLSDRLEASVTDVAGHVGSAAYARAWQRRGSDGRKAVK